MTNHAPKFAGWPRQSGRVVGTLIPDVFPDFLLADLSGSETKLLIYVLRHTSGYGKEADEISLAQFVHGITKRDGTVVDRGTGLSEPTVISGLRGLIEKGVLICERRRDPRRGDLPNTYRLRWEGEGDQDDLRPGPKAPQPPPAAGFGPREEDVLDPGPKRLDTQEATGQEATNKVLSSSLRSEDIPPHQPRSICSRFKDPAVERVFRTWLASLPPSQRHRERTPARRAAIVAALKRASEEKVLAAVVGWRWDDWPGRRQNNELIDVLRPKNLDRFAEWERDPCSRPGFEPVHRTAASAMRHALAQEILAEQRGDHP